MKHFTYLLTIAVMVFISACKKGEVTPSDLSGKWTLIANYYSAGGPMLWANAPAGNNSYVQFDTKGNLTGNVFTRYSKYAVKDSVILTFTGSTGAQNYYYKIAHDTLTMSLAPPILCIEGCGMRFVKD